MSIAMLSALSLICMDAAMAARPLGVAPLMAVQSAGEAPSLTAPPDNDIENQSPMVDPSTDEQTVSEEPADDPLVFDGESDDALVDRLMDYLQEIETLNGDFTQIAPSGAISSGRFYIRRPGFLRFEYDPPTPLLIVANGGMVYVRDEALETTDSYPVGRTPLKFLLRKKIDLGPTKVVGVDRGVDSFAVTLGSDDEETEGELTMIVKAPELSLVRWVVRDIQNGITVVSLDNVKSGEKLANRLFRTPDAGGQFLKN